MDCELVINLGITIGIITNNQSMATVCYDNNHLYCESQGIKMYLLQECNKLENNILIPMKALIQIIKKDLKELLF